MSYFAAARVLRARAERLRARNPASDTEIAGVKKWLWLAPGAFGAWLGRRVAQELDEAAKEVERAGDAAVTPPAEPK